jgi:hypothetical protein
MPAFYPGYRIDSTNVCPNHTLVVGEHGFGYKARSHAFVIRLSA